MVKSVRAAGPLILLIAFTFSVYPDEVADILYKEGIKEYILKDYNSAIAAFESAFRLDPENLKIKKMYLNALIKQGNIEYENNNMTMAKDLFARALGLSGEDPELQQKLSQIQERIDDENKTPSRTAPEAVNGQEKTVLPVTAVEKEELISEKAAPGDAAIEESSVPVAAREAVEPGKSDKEQIGDAPSAAAELPDNGSETVPAVVPTIVQVEMPFDIDAFIRQQQEENKSILNEIILSQKEERENLIRNMEMIAESQQEDRRFFNRSLVLVLAGAGGIVAVPIIVIVILSFVRRRSNGEAAPVGASVASLPDKTTLLLESGENLDDSKYMAEDHYSEIVRAQRLRDLYREFTRGNLTWDTVSEYLSELNHELKSEILSVVERKLDSGDTVAPDSALQVLMPFVTDEGTDIRSRGKSMAQRIAGSPSSPMGLPSNANLHTADGGDDPLSLSALQHLARLIDTKSGIADHSVKVSEIAAEIADRLQNPEVDPLDAQKVGLIHNIGYLEIPDDIFKQDGPLSEEQADIVKSHPERGVYFMAYANPPKLYEDGIRYHHERLNGSGYPEGLQGSEIPLLSRIIAVADSFVAAISPRPYRKALSAELALEMMEKIAGTLIDERIISILAEMIASETGRQP